MNFGETNVAHSTPSSFSKLLKIQDPYNVKGSNKLSTDFYVLDKRTVKEMCMKFTE